MTDTALTTKNREDILARMQSMKESGSPMANPTAGRGTQYIRFDGNTGNVTYGRDHTPLPTTQELVAPAELFYHGATFWQNKKPDNQRRLRVNILDNPVCPEPPEGEPRQGDLPKPRERDGWANELGLMVFGIGGDLDKIQLEFGTSAEGQKNAILDLWGAIFRQFDTPDGQKGFINPIFLFKVNSYDNKTYDRTIFVPEFELIGWTDDKGNRIGAGDAALLTDGNDDEIDPFA